ncbi:MAG: hypothetical protein M1118_06555 [Chloroflexi bacterium]|nr:hypothetical protein [Chloroflexota bacterium]
MNYTLTVDLLAEAAVGTGSGSAEVDREVPIDHRGLPVIAGRRLKGLLREATLEVWEALLQARFHPRRGVCPARGRRRSE